MKLLIFDLDGTLIDSKRDIATSVNLTFRDVGLPEKPPETIYGYVGNGVRQLIIDSLETDDAAQIDHSLRIFREHYLNHLLDETTLFPGITSVLHYYRKIAKAVVTNKPEPYTTKIIEGLKIDKDFDLAISAETGIPLKPHPAMILKTLKRLDIAPSEAVMIGDSLNDIDAASAAGVRSCGVAYGFGTSDEIKSAHPDYFVETAEALIGLFDRL